MSEQMQASLIKLIEKASSGIDASVSFLSAEIPDVVNQLLVWYAVKSAIWFILSLALVAMGVYVYRIKSGVTKAQAQEAYNNKEPWTRYGSCSTVTSSRYDAIMAAPFEHAMAKICGAVIVFLAALMVMANLSWLQILIAPKIWLIEYAAHLAK